MPKIANLPHPLQQLLDQIVQTAEDGLHLVAIGMAAALPDMCAALSNENGRTTANDYREWCANNLNTPQFSQLTPEDLYSFRCGVLHQGRFGGLKNGVSRVIFVPPDSGFGFVNCMIEDAYFYGVLDFCRNMCAAAERWYAANCENPTVIANLGRMMGYHPEGLAPYAKGFVLIA